MSAFVRFCPVRKKCFAARGESGTKWHGLARQARKMLGLHLYARLKLPKSSGVRFFSRKRIAFPFSIGYDPFHHSRQFCTSEVPNDRVHSQV